MIAPTSTELFVLALRVVFVLSLYALLVWVTLNVRRGISADDPVEAPGSRPSRLEVVTSPRGNPELGIAFELVEVTTIGRTIGNHVVLPDLAVSALHARIEWAKSHWLLTDLESTNGTLVNGSPIMSPARLKSGDSIAFGSIVLRLM